MPDETYNGWTNYATWGVALVLNNDESTYNAVRAQAHEIRSTNDRPDLDLADWVKDFTEELCGLEEEHEDYLTPMARQVLAAGLAKVDWHEIAENVLSES